MKKLMIDARAGGQSDGWLNLNLIYQNGLVDDQKQLDVEELHLAARKHDNSMPAIINIEAWPSDDPRYIDVIDQWRSVNSASRIGYYSILPIRHYWAPVKGAHHEQWWKAKNDDLSKRLLDDGTFADRGLADVVDFVCPSLYTFYAADQGGYGGRNHERLWFETYAPKNCEIAKSWNKQVYPFIWPRFHDSNRKRQWQYIGDDFFRRQIEWCLEHCDGVVVWDSAYFERVKPDVAGVIEQATKVMESISRE